MAKVKMTIEDWETIRTEMEKGSISKSAVADMFEWMVEQDLRGQNDKGILQVNMDNVRPSGDPIQSTMYEKGYEMGFACIKADPSPSLGTLARDEWILGYRDGLGDGGHTTQLARHLEWNDTAPK